MNSSSNRRHGIGRVLRRLAKTAFPAFVMMGAGAGPSLAQITTSPNRTTPPSPQPVQLSQSQRETMNAQALLTSALQRIAANESDANALIDAGNAANILEDGNAAMGFFNRANAVSPNNGRVTAGMAIALVKLENPAEALRLFEKAARQGVNERMFLVDRGLAYDLTGDNVRAQRDFQLALQTNPSDRALRYYGLSLGIQGDADKAVQTIAPLLQRKDRAAWRDRAFILAMNGRMKEALAIVKQTMPANVANGLTPYLMKMNRLSTRQMAAAVHYGQFPTNDAQLAAVGRVPGAAVLAATTRTAASKTTATRASGNQVAAMESGKTPRFVDEDGRPVKLSKSEQRRLIKEQEEKKIAELAAQQDRDRKAFIARQAEDARIKEQERLAILDRQRQEEANRAAETRRLEEARLAEAKRVEEARRVEQARLASAPPAAIAPVVLAAANPSPIRPASTAPALASPARDAAGPVDRGATPVISAPLPQSTIVPVNLPPSPAAADMGAIEVAAVRPTPPPASASGTESFKAFSLDQLVQAVRPPDSGPVRGEAPIDLATLEKLNADTIATKKAAAARIKAEAEQKKLADAKAKEKKGADPKSKKEAEAQAKLDADSKKTHPARSWVQISTGNARGVAGDYKKASSGKNAALFKGKTGHSAAAGKQQRVVVGPFTSAKEANAWLAKYKKNGGSGVVWTSGAGEEVSKIGSK